MDPLSWTYLPLLLAGHRGAVWCGHRGSSCKAGVLIDLDCCSLLLFEAHICTCQLKSKREEGGGESLFSLTARVDSFAAIPSPELKKAAHAHVAAKLKSSSCCLLAVNLEVRSVTLSYLLCCWFLNITKMLPGQDLKAQLTFLDLNKAYAWHFHPSRGYYNRARVPV